MGISSPQLGMMFKRVEATDKNPCLLHPVRWNSSADGTHNIFPLLDLMIWVDVIWKMLLGVILVGRIWLIGAHVPCGRRIKMLLYKAVVPKIQVQDIHHASK